MSSNASHKPWLQKPDETDKAYRAFEAYLQERGATLLDAYLEYVEWRYDEKKEQRKKKKSAKSRGGPPGHIGKWAQNHNWSRRRKAYWRHIDEQAYDELMESKKRRKVERIELLDEAFEALEGNLGELLNKILSNGDADVQDVTFLLDKLLRQYREELDDLPTQEVDMAGADEIAAMLGVELSGDDG